jgi:hypothetical protein
MNGFPRYRLPQLLCAAALISACAVDSEISYISTIGDTFDREGPYTISVMVTEPRRVEVSLNYRTGGADSVIPMGKVEDGIFQAAIPGQPAFTLIEYQVELKDGDRVTFLPEQGKSWHSFWVLGTDCANDFECGSGESCDASGRCRAVSGTCKVDADCGNNLRCGPDGSCRIQARSCSLDAGCLAGEVCDAQLKECIPRPRCLTGESCPLDYTCRAEWCWRSCAGDADCGPGETCATESGGSYCKAMDPCGGEADPPCATGLVCDPLIKLCRFQGAALCAPCNEDQFCGGPSDFCMVIGKTQACGQDCSVEDCPTDYTCSQDTSPPQCQPSSGSCPAFP